MKMLEWFLVHMYGYGFMDHCIHVLSIPVAIAGATTVKEEYGSLVLQ